MLTYFRKKKAKFYLSIVLSILPSSVVDQWWKGTLNYSSRCWLSRAWQEKFKFLPAIALKIYKQPWLAIITTHSWRLCAPSGELTCPLHFTKHIASSTMTLQMITLLYHGLFLRLQFSCYSLQLVELCIPMSKITRKISAGFRKRYT